MFFRILILLEDGEVKSGVRRHLRYTDRTCPLESVCVCGCLEGHELRWNRNIKYNSIFKKGKRNTICGKNRTDHRELECAGIVDTIPTTRSEVVCICIERIHLHI